MSVWSKYAIETDSWGSPLTEEIGFIYEMANIRKTDTGLPVNIWASPRSPEWRKGLRIKVGNLYSNRFHDNQSFAMFFDGDEIKTTGDTGEISGKDVEEIKSYFRKNRPIFDLFWNSKIDDDDLKELLRKSKTLPAWELIQKDERWDLIPPKT